jgi:hypothetical protein
MSTFSEALEDLKEGKRVTRHGWNGGEMFLFLVPGSTFNVNRPPLLGIYPEGTEISYQSHIDIKTADGSIVPWLPSQSDLLATDWTNFAESDDEINARLEAKADEEATNTDVSGEDQ